MLIGHIVSVVGKNGMVMRTILRITVIYAEKEKQE